MFTCSLRDFIGYCMAVTSTVDQLHISPDDADNWEIRFDGVRFDNGFTSYDVSFRELKKRQKSASTYMKQKR